MPLIHEGPNRSTASIELTRPVPLQDVAEGIVCGAPPEVEDRHDDGLSDDDSEWARRVSPQVTLLSTISFPSLPLLRRGRAAFQRLRRFAGGVTQLSEPLGPHEAIGRAPSHDHPMTWRHDPYRPVLPSWLALADYDDESVASAEEATYTEAAEQYDYDWDDGPTVVEPSSSSYEQGDWDAPRAAQCGTPAAAAPSPSLPVNHAATRMIADPFADVEEELRREDEATSRAQAPAAAAPEPRVMCCYFKQFGRCKMGADCWYSHEGTADTPCHYGGICKAGHAHLVRTGNAAVPPKRTAESKRSRNSEHRERSGESAAAHTQTQKPKAAGASAPLTPSNLPCAFCGDSQGVLLQEFPVYEGSTRRMAFRAHCINPSCMRVYSL